MQGSVGRRIPGTCPQVRDVDGVHLLGQRGRHGGGRARCPRSLGGAWQRDSDGLDCYRLAWGDVLRGCSEPPCPIQPDRGG